MQQSCDREWVYHYTNPIIKEIHLHADGYCTIYFRNETVVRHFVNCEAVYQAQFGLPISLDGKYLFISSWEHGLTAFDTLSGELRWQHKKSKIKSVFPYSNFVVACQYGIGLIKIDIDTGAVLQEIKSGTLEKCYDLDSKHLLLDRWRGKLSVIDGEAMEIVKTYPEKIYNPNDCWSLVITNAYLENGEIIIEGFENYANHNLQESNQRTFCRVIDSGISGGDGDLP